MTPVKYDDKWIYGVAVILAACAIAASFKTGYSIPPDDALAGVIIGCILAGISVLVARGLTKIDRDVTARQWGRAGLSTVAWLAFLATEIGTCAMFQAGERGESVQKAEFQNVAYGDARAQVTDNKSLRDLYKTQLAEFQAQNGWAAVVTATGERAKLKSASDAIAQEQARGGCGPVCLKLEREQADLQGRIATLEKKDDLQKKIDDTQVKIDQLVSVADTTTKGSSRVLGGAVVLAALGSRTLNPSAEAIGWTVLLQSGWLGIIGSIGAAIAFWWAGKREDAIAAPQAPAIAPAMSLTVPRAPVSVPDAIEQRITRITRSVLGAVNPAMPAVTHISTKEFAEAA